MERHNNFDLMRLLAAASVILSHAFLLAENSQAHDPLMILTGGQTILGLAGVFAFFTISGYLISQSFEATPSPWQFLAKRALRIFPGLVACLAVCAFVVGPLVSRLGPAAYFARPEPYLFVAHNAVLDVEFNRLPGVEFWAGNIGGIVNGPLWSLPCEAILYLILFALGRLRLLVLPVTLIMLAVGIVCLWFDTSGSTFGSVFWLMGFFAAGMCAYRLRRRGLIAGRCAAAISCSISRSSAACRRSRRRASATCPTASTSTAGRSSSASSISAAGAPPGGRCSASPRWLPRRSPSPHGTWSRSAAASAGAASPRPGRPPISAPPPPRRPSAPPPGRRGGRAAASAPAARQVRR